MSVKQQTRRPETVLVIDHYPKLQRRSAFELPGVNLIANAGKKGLARARNAGVAAATAEIVAFLNDETVAARNWFAALVAPYADPHMLGVGGQVVPSGRRGVRAGSRVSSTGLLDAVAAACPLSEPWCTTSVVETCRCGVASSNAVVSMLRLVGSAPDDSLARRRRCASACRQASIAVNKLYPNSHAV
jgi:GT2 family glycosyltransferase